MQKKILDLLKKEITFDKNAKQDMFTLFLCLKELKAHRFIHLNPPL